MRKLRVLDLFSGIGGFSLGLERAGGFETVAFCEIEDYPRRVLAKHWPHVPCYDDVRTLTADALRRDGIAVDVICGGFPCQDVSLAGKRAGLAGERSGLWSEYRRLVGELRPRFVIVENVPGILSSGVGDVLGELAAFGYDCLWECIPAAAVGAPHRRDRWWCIAANTERHKLREQPRRLCRQNRPGSARIGGVGPIGASPNAESDRRPNKRQWPAAGHADGSGELRLGWEPDRQPEPVVCRMGDGVPNRLDRLRALGNAVVPQIPELIGRAIMQAEGMTP